MHALAYCGYPWLRSILKQFTSILTLNTEQKYLWPFEHIPSWELSGCYWHEGIYGTRDTVSQPVIVWPDCVRKNDKLAKRIRKYKSNCITTKSTLPIYIYWYFILIFIYYVITQLYSRQSHHFIIVDFLKNVDNILRHTNVIFSSSYFVSCGFIYFMQILCYSKTAHNLGHSETEMPPATDIFTSYCYLFCVDRLQFSRQRLQGMGGISLHENTCFTV